MVAEAACASNDGVTCAKAPKFSACHRRFQYQGLNGLLVPLCILHRLTGLQVRKLTTVIGRMSPLLTTALYGLAAFHPYAQVVSQVQILAMRAPFVDGHGL